MKSVQIRCFFWSVFSRIRSEYGDLRSKSVYGVSPNMEKCEYGKIQTRKNFVFGYFSRGDKYYFRSTNFRTTTNVPTYMFDRILNTPH